VLLQHVQCHVDGLDARHVSGVTLFESRTTRTSAKFPWLACTGLPPQ
jgi:hypothetical protein